MTESTNNEQPTPDTEHSTPSNHQRTTNNEQPTTMFKTLEYLKFLLASTNQHGVHSPFVYSYVTKCLYTKSLYNYPKTTTVLLKTMTYFGVKTIGLSNEKKTMKKLIRNEFPEIRINTENNDAVYLDSTGLESGLSFESLKINENGIGFVESIYQSKKHKNMWEKVKKSPHVTVTVDLFHCGIVFFRKEQAKEHFKIRI